MSVGIQIIEEKEGKGKRKERAERSKSRLESGKSGNSSNSSSGIRKWPAPAWKLISEISVTPYRFGPASSPLT